MSDSPIVVMESVHWVELLALVGYALMCLLSLLLIVYLRVNRREAFKGDPHASRKVILPAFEPLLWILAASTGIYVFFFSVALKIKLYTIGFPNLDREFFYCGRMFVFTLVLMFLCQKSVSLPALRCAVFKTLLVSCYTLPIVWVFSHFAPQRLTLLYFVKLGARPLLLIFVVYVCFLHPPAGRANPQVLRTHGWRKISSGKQGAMFSGLLRSTKVVAVKVYTPQYFTEEIVGEFSHEAALCAGFSHPNIVEFYGMCVCPPTICLVSDLCSFTLEDVLGARGKYHDCRRTIWLGQANDDNNGDSKLELQRMQLNIAYMLDCSRAVAYVHSFSPPFLHRDIKPANFLLDTDNNLKLTDFSDSRRLPSELPVSTGNPSGNSKLSTLIKPKMTVTGTVDYMAPEMINSRTGLAAYAEAADVYSLAITFWDMLYPDREKYPDTYNNHLLIFEGVLGGSRPPIHDDVTLDEVVPPRLLDLITSAWRSDPNTRPTAQQLVSELEKIQEELLAALAQDLLSDFEPGNADYPECADKVFTGECAIERMEELKVVESKSEGIRIGRALMDAGFLHHFEHSCGFRDSSTSLYFLDDDNISFCQPLAILEESANASQNSEDGHVTSQSYQQVPASTRTKLRKRSRLLSHLASTFLANGQTASDAGSSQNGQCACRMLGQLRDVPVAPSSGRHRRQRRRLTLSQNSNSICSTGSASVLAPTPRRWQLRKKSEPENSLRNKLLDDVQQQNYVVDFPRDGSVL
ncbi:hypothetical protein PF006_g617 [Phytophthora fragariae]|uniref:Protein kinase domain-containing protein n=2 Tax=Phytophthora fragariae TaxID=53985 RepID=A0A6A3UW33_9STRA|nr:hypothetical protein PF003_g20696 [Phytophthora fragariae]KAE9023794.1 hypothetical protein PF011_g3803 [Phytophthora fragariae]KAE9155453.1 hypothetical protein PF006_g617 [Phytophthora fragariae]